MKKIDLLSIPLDEGAYNEVYRVAIDEFSNSDSYNTIFFFGKLINDNTFVEPVFDERKYYTKCPCCDKVIKLKNEPVDGNPYVCPHCGCSGTLYDFHDPKSSVNDYVAFNYAFLEKLDKGFVLRLFDIFLDYSGRDMDCYTSLEAYPDLLIDEVAREYWYEGKVKYYEAGETGFIETPSVFDCDYSIVNYYNDWDPIGSPFIQDIICECLVKSFIESIAKRGSYRSFETLNKYGFEQLLNDFVYVPNIFGDSKKISEVLQLDYNQVLAYGNVDEICAGDILAMRELKQYGLSFSDKNVSIMRDLSELNPPVYNANNAKKTFKYLRNQMSRANGKGVARDYYDYICECRKLGLNTDNSDIRYPTDLNRAHTRTSELVRYEANRAVDERLREVYERLHDFCEWSDGVFCVVMPSCCEDIIREGKLQNHCVGNYCERMAKGEDVILFIRKVKESDKPFYTFEIRPSMKKLDIVQCRGLRNADRSKDVDDFLSRYETWFNRRKCNVEAGMTRKYYKAVCKSPDGRYISNWDKKTEYRIGEVIETCTDLDSDRTATAGIHIASLEFAKNYGDTWENPAILEIEVDMRDVVVPNAKDQLRTKRGRVLREVPLSELGDWGVRHAKGGAA